MKLEVETTGAYNGSVSEESVGLSIKSEQGQKLVESVSILKAMSVRATDEPQDNRDIEDALRVSLLRTLEDVRGQLDGIASAEGASPEVKRMVEEGQQTLAAVRDNCTNGRLDAGRAVSAVQGLLALSARAAGLSGAGGNVAALDSVAERTAKLRASTTALYDDLFKKDVLRDSLRFDSAEDQREYEKRQRERQEAVDQARAKGTPEGDREANRLNMDQLKDAENHGAASDPDFQRMKQQATENLRAAEDLVISKNSDEIGEALAKSGVTISSADISVPTVPDARSAPIRSL